MNPASLMTQPVTITLRVEDGAPDRYGNPTVTETPFDTLCFAEQRSSSSTGPEAQVLQARWKLMLPAATPINGWAKVELDNRPYEVVGFPWYVRNPRTGLISHVEADLETAA